MHAARLRFLLLLCLGVLALAAGDAGGGRRVSTPPLIGFDTYFEPVGDFEATRLVRIDPVTLRRLPGRALKLHDYASSRVLGPDGRSLAIGGYNYGELIVVDLARLARTARLKVAVRMPDAYSTVVDAVSWPRPDRILAVVTQSPGRYVAWSTLVVVDPVRQRVLRKVPFGGDVHSSLRLHDGRAVFLVSRDRGNAPVRLVISDADGRTRTVRLTRMFAGGPAGVLRSDGLASDGRHVFVVGGREPIASVELRTLAVTYHQVPRLMVAHLPVGPASETGSAGPQLAFSREAAWLGNGRLLVTGYDEFPAPGLRARWVTRAATIVDTRTWHLQHVFENITALRPAGGILLGSGTEFDSSATRVSLAAFRPDGTLLYRKSRSNFSWAVVAGRLVVGRPDGTRLVELNPRTGRPIRRIGPAAIWPLDAVSWAPR